MLQTQVSRQALCLTLILDVHPKADSAGNHVPRLELALHAVFDMHVQGNQDLQADVPTAYLTLLHVVLKVCGSYAGVSAIPESVSGELRALESGTLSSQGGVDIAPERAELGTQTSNGLAENGSSVA